MQLVFLVIRWEGVVFVCTLFAVVSWKCVTRRIWLMPLLDADAPAMHAGTRSPSRKSGAGAFSLAVSVIVAVWYLWNLLRDPTAFPKVPIVLVVLFAASQLLYVWSKVSALVFHRPNVKPE